MSLHSPKERTLTVCRWCWRYRGSSIPHNSFSHFHSVSALLWQRMMLSLQTVQKQMQQQEFWRAQVTNLPAVTGHLWRPCFHCARLRQDRWQAKIEFPQWLHQNFRTPVQADLSVSHQWIKIVLFGILPVMAMGLTPWCYFYVFWFLE